MEKLILLILVSTVLTAYDSDKCRILALQGGGDKGSYQVGVFSALVDLLPKEETSYDLVTGVSVGSINGGLISVFEPGQEKEVAKELVDYWMSIKSSSDIFENWTVPIVAGLWESSFFSTEPLKKLLSSKLTGKTQKRDFFVGVSNRNTGKYESIFSNEVCEDEKCLIDSVLASSAIPAIFPNREFKGQTYIDGGVINNLDIFSGVNKCKAEGFKEEDIVVDAIQCSSSNLEPYRTKGNNLLSLLGRVRKITSLRRDITYTEGVKKAFPGVNFRYIVGPKKELDDGILPINFNPEATKKFIDMGYEDGKEAVNAK